MSPEPAHRRLPVAGATDLLVQLTGELGPAPAACLDLWRLDELRGIAVKPSALVIGALTTFADVRRSAARLINSPSVEDVCFVPNTTWGIGIVAEGFPWQTGDNAIASTGAEAPFGADSLRPVASGFVATAAGTALLPVFVTPQGMSSDGGKTWTPSVAPSPALNQAGDYYSLSHVVFGHVK